MKFKKLLQFLQTEGYADDIVGVIEDPSRFNELNNDLEYHADEDVRAEYRALQRAAKGDIELEILNLVENQMVGDPQTMIDAPTQKNLDFSQTEVGDLPSGDVELNPFEQLPDEAQQFLVERGYGPADQNPNNPFTAEDYLSALEREGFGTTDSGATDPGMGREGREDRLSFADMYRQAQEQGTPFGALSEEDAGLIYDRGYSEGMPDVPAYGAEQIASLVDFVKNPKNKASGPPRVDPNAPRGTKFDELDSVQKNEKRFVDSLREAMPDSELYSGVTKDPKNVLSGGVGPDNPSGTTPEVIEQRVRDGVKAYQESTAPSEAELSGFRTESSEGVGGQTMSAGDVQKFVNNPDLKNPVTVAEARNTGGAVPVAGPIEVGALPTSSLGGAQFTATAGNNVVGGVITDAINQAEALQNMQQNPVTKSLLDGNEPNANTPQPQQKNPFASTAGMAPEPVATPAAQQTAAAPPPPAATPYSGNVGEGSKKDPAFLTGLMGGRFNQTPYPVTQLAQSSTEGLLGVSPSTARVIRTPTMPVTNTADILMRNPGRTATGGLIAAGIAGQANSISEEQAMGGSIPGMAMQVDAEGNMIPVEVPQSAPATEEMQGDLQSAADQALNEFTDFVTGQSGFQKIEANQQQLKSEDRIRKIREGI